ncbi:MAG TPA: M3 family metallopeptidase [Jatrophihabitans sp.]
MTEPLALPADDWTGWLRRRVETALTEARDQLAALKDGAPRDTDAVLACWNATDLALRNAGAVAHLLAEVHPEPEVRALGDELSREVHRLDTDRELDRDLYDVIAATTPAQDPSAERLRERVLRDYRRSGVHLDDTAVARLRELAERLVTVEQDFGRVIREDTRAVRARPEQLDGLPEDFRAAHPAGSDGLVELTTDYPDLIPIVTFCRDEQLRRELVAASLNRAWPTNDPVLAEMLELRAERAGLLGHDGWPDYDAEVKMIGSGKAIIDFVDQLVAVADAPGRRDLAVLQEQQRRDQPDAVAMTRADSRYYEELVRRESYDVDAQQVRRYFDFGRVRAGLLDVTSRLLGIEYRERTDVSTWHEDVTAYDVLLDNEPIGRIYLDLHPREGKFKHAAQFDLAPGVTDVQLAEGALVCNLPRGLMEHSHVVTLFHEFGHLVHHVLAGRQRYARFSGVATEWDFVEAPSMLLEHWAWDADVLASFALDEDGTAIPRELVERMRAADRFGKALFVRSQAFYAALAYLLHRDRPRDLLQTSIETQRRYDLIDYLDGTHFYASFGHLAGYTSAYYTYLWSLVIAKDLFAQFDPADLLDPEIARRYRDEILAPGGSREAAELVEAFLGRPYSFDAFEGWLAGR